MPPGLPYNHDAVFDPQGGRFPIAMTWSLGGSRIDTGKLGGANTLLGFMRLNDNLAPLFQLYYRTDSATRNEGVRISLADSASYLIGANTYHPQVGTSLSRFRVSKTGAPLLYQRYNAGMGSRLWALCLFSDGQDDWFATGGNSDVPMGSNDYNTRIIVTDITGKYCGEEELKAHRDDYTSYPANGLLRRLEVRDYESIQLGSPAVDEQTGHCDNTNLGHSKTGR